MQRLLWIKFDNKIYKDFNSILDIQKLDDNKIRYAIEKGILRYVFDE